MFARMVSNITTSYGICSTVLSATQALSEATTADNQQEEQN